MLSYHSIMHCKDWKLRKSAQNEDDFSFRAARAVYRWNFLPVRCTQIDAHHHRRRCSHGVVVRCCVCAGRRSRVSATASPFQDQTAANSRSHDAQGPPCLPAREALSGSHHAHSKPLLRVRASLATSQPLTQIQMYVRRNQAIYCLAT